MLTLFFILWIVTFVGLGGGMLLTYGVPKSNAEKAKVFAQIFFGSLLGAVLYTGLGAGLVAILGPVG